jgi:hypothetical protein
LVRLVIPLFNVVHKSGRVKLLQYIIVSTKLMRLYILEL